MAALRAEDLDFVADALIALCEVDAATPAYTDAVFRHKLRLARAREPVIARTLQTLSPDPLGRDEIKTLLARARLTPYQHECLTLRLDGFTFADVGHLSGTTKQSVRATFIRALAKLRQAWREYPHAGLADVYRAETRRGRTG